MAWASYPRRCLRELREETLLRIFGMEVERLLRIAEESPLLAGTGDWTSAALGASEHIAQLYAELKRRHKAQRARAILSLELRQYVDWQPARPRPKRNVSGSRRASVNTVSQSRRLGGSTLAFCNAALHVPACPLAERSQRRAITQPSVLLPGPRMRTIHAGDPEERLA